LSAARRLATERFEMVVLDSLDRLIERVEQIAGDRSNVVPLWLSKKELAEVEGVSVRWIEQRVAETKDSADPFPHRELAGKLQFNRSLVESWLVKHGYLREVGQ
jgi:hypothetical protein